jgi:hypothetical protein
MRERSLNFILYSEVYNKHLNSINYFKWELEHLDKTPQHAVFA